MRHVRAVESARVHRATVSEKSIQESPSTDKLTDLEPKALNYLVLDAVDQSLDGA